MTCEMEKDCKMPVTHIGNKGWVYCKEHGIYRRVYGHESTRQMRAWEITRLNAGMIISYEYRGKP